MKETCPDLAKQDGAVLSETMIAPDELTIHQMNSFGNDLIMLLKQEGMVNLDLSLVQKIDAAGLQLLLMADKEASHQSGSLHFSNPAPAVVEILEFCGVSHLLAQHDSSLSEGKESGG